MQRLNVARISRLLLHPFRWWMGHCGARIRCFLHWQAARSLQNSPQILPMRPCPTWYYETIIRWFYSATNEISGMRKNEKEINHGVSSMRPQTNIVMRKTVNILKLTSERRKVLNITEMWFWRTCDFGYAVKLMKEIGLIWRQRVSANYNGFVAVTTSHQPRANA
jgi:hypothetical protein